MLSPSTSLRYAQDERESVSLWMRECTNLLWFDLVTIVEEMVKRQGQTTDQLVPS
jgi:hypothetical protein